MVIPRFISAALKNEDVLVYDDGSQSRVFCHVDDAVRAVLDLVDSRRTIGDYFNIGGIGETSMRQLAEIVISRTNSKSKIKFIPYSEAYPQGFEDMQRRIPDITKIRKAIGWEPVHNLETIIDSVVSGFGYRS